MAQIQRTIFFLCIATAYAASITNITEEDLSAEIEEPTNYDSKAENNMGQVTEYDPISPNYIVTELETNGFQMGKSLIQALFGLLQIVKEMDLSQAGLKNVSFLVARMVSMFAGQYYEILKKLMPVFSGMAMALLETLR